MGRHKGYKMSEEQKNAIREAHLRRTQAPLQSRIFNGIISFFAK